MLWSAGAATLIVTGFCILRSPREEPAGLPVAEHGVTSPASPGLPATRLGVGVDRVDNRPSSMVPATGPRPAPSLREDPVRRLLQDVASGRMVLDTDEDGFDVLDLNQPDAVPMIVRLWAQRSWAEASQWTKALPESEIKSASLRQIAVVLTKADPSAAQQWVKALGAGPSREAAVESIATELATAYPEQAIQLAEELAPGGTREQALTHVFSQWSALDPAAAIANARTIQDAASRSNALSAVATSWADSDPAGAARLAAGEIEDEATQNRAVVSIVQRWAQKDPATAAAWIKDFDPRDDISKGAVEQLVVQWSMHDADAARRWLAGLPNVTTRDSGLASLAHALAFSQPGQAAQCAQLISDPAIRQRCLLALEKQ